MHVLFSTSLLSKILFTLIIGIIALSFTFEAPVNKIECVCNSYKTYYLMVFAQLSLTKQKLALVDSVAVIVLYYLTP